MDTFLCICSCASCPCHIMQAFELCALITGWLVPLFFFIWRYFWVLRNNFLIHLTTGQSLAEKTAEWCPQMASSLHDQMLVCEWRGTVFTRNDVWKSSWARAIMSTSKSDLFDSNIASWPFPLCTEISPDSWNVFMIIWTVWWVSPMSMK